MEGTGPDPSPPAKFVTVNFQTSELCGLRIWDVCMIRLIRRRSRVVGGVVDAASGGGGVGVDGVDSAGGMGVGKQVDAGDVAGNEGAASGGGTARGEAVCAE